MRYPQHLVSLPFILREPKVFDSEAILIFEQQYSWLLLDHLNPHLVCSPFLAQSHLQNTVFIQKKYRFYLIAFHGWCHPL